MISIIMLPLPFDRISLPQNAFTDLGEGEMVFREGDRARAIILVVSGRIALVRHTSSGVRVILHTAGAGDTTAEASLFSSSYHCDCVAIVRSRIVRLGKSAVMRKMDGDPNFSKLLTQRFASQVINYRRRIELLAIRGSDERVLAALADGWLTGTIMDFATSIGLTHEVVYRTLASLTKKGRVEKLGRGRYRIPDGS